MRRLLVGPEHSGPRAVREVSLWTCRAWRSGLLWEDHSEYGRYESPSRRQPLGSPVCVEIPKARRQMVLR